MKKICLIFIINLLTLPYLQPDICVGQMVISQIIDKKIFGEDEYQDYTELRTKTSNEEPRKQPALVPSEPVPCHNEKLGVTFLCRPNWIKKQIKNGFSLIIAPDKSLVMKIIKITESFRFLNQLDRQTLQRFGNYADGFAVENVAFANHQAFKVKALSNAAPQSRLTDFYLLHEGALYKVTFSVNPKERWDEHKFLIQQLSNAFTF